MRSTPRFRLRWLAGCVAGLLAVAACANRWSADRSAALAFADDDAWVADAADALAEDMRGGTTPAEYHTGDPRFDGEWALVTCQMTVLALGQLLPRFPDREARWRPAIRSCSAWMQSAEARAFGTAAWGVDALEDPDLEHAHVYLGYTNSALAVAGRTGDAEAQAASDRLSLRLATSLAGRSPGQLETYPGEVYPPDLAVALGSLALHGGYDEVVEPFLDRFRQDAIEPGTGLLRQSLPGGAPRGSGTMLAVYFLGFADPALADSLARAAQRHLKGGFLGFGGVREVPVGAPSAWDIDSGPVVFGLSVSASGFGLAATRRLEDAAWHRGIVRSAFVAGLPTRRRYLAGGSLGNAILLAMETAPRPGPHERDGVE